ncbi:MAG: DUF4383 domain-containing protein [Caldilineaceae bacterium]|nr:DUF4383 domain-containing protein [Caldilineaceae bacterium]
MNPIRKWAWGYAALFVAVVALGYIPGLTDEQGALLGLFHIELKDDLLHLGSALWAAIAAWRSAAAARFYFRLFGLIYFFDGVSGLLFGQGYLDFGIFLYGPTQLDLATRIGANIPHLLIGGIAILVGFVFSRRWAQT